jgi:transposase
VARSTVALTLERVAAAQLGWPLPATLTDRVLEATLYPSIGRPQGSRGKVEPDWTHVHRELRRPGVTLMLQIRTGDRSGFAAVPSSTE